MIKNGLNFLIYHHTTISQNGTISTNFWLPLFPQQATRPLGCGEQQGCMKTLQVLFDMDVFKGCRCCSCLSGRQLRSRESILFQKCHSPIFPKGIRHGLSQSFHPVLGGLCLACFLLNQHKKMFLGNGTTLAEVRLYLVASCTASAVNTINTSFQRRLQMIRILYR